MQARHGSLLTTSLWPSCWAKLCWSLVPSTPSPWVPTLAEARWLASPQVAYAGGWLSPSSLSLCLCNFPLACGSWCSHAVWRFRVSSRDCGARGPFSHRSSHLELFGFHRSLQISWYYLQVQRSVAFSCKYAFFDLFRMDPLARGGSPCFPMCKRNFYIGFCFYRRKWLYLQLGPLVLGKFWSKNEENLKNLKTYCKWMLCV